MDIRFPSGKRLITVCNHRDVRGVCVCVSVLCVRMCRFVEPKTTNGKITYEQICRFFFLFFFFYWYWTLLTETTVSLDASPNCFARVRRGIRWTGKMCGFSCYPHYSSTWSVYFVPIFDLIFRDNMQDIFTHAHNNRLSTQIYCTRSCSPRIIYLFFCFIFVSGYYTICSGYAFLLSWIHWLFASFSFTRGRRTLTGHSVVRSLFLPRAKPQQQRTNWCEYLGKSRVCECEIICIWKEK